MIQFLNYSFQVTIIMLLLFAFWKLFLQKETHNYLYRIYLLSSFVLSFIIPLININMGSIADNEIIQKVSSAILINEIVVNSTESTFYIFDYLFLAYFIISIFLLIRFSIRIISIIKFKKNCKVVYYNGTKIFVSKNKISPFSFFNNIFFDEETVKRNNFNEILIHELAHVKQKHTFDIILIELTKIIMWINPMIYVYQIYLKMLHEYLSDEKVILQGFEKDKYKMLLINLQIGSQFKIANHFNKSLTLKRINMLNKIKSNKMSKLKVLLVFPLIAIIFVLFSFSGQRQIIGLGDEIMPNDTIYTYVKHRPEFKGGIEALRNFLGKTVVYPKIAKKNKIEGTVYVKFVVDKKGKVKNALVQKGVSKELDKAAIDAILKIPDFKKPGYNNKGEAVDVWSSMPVTFRLN